MRTQFALPSFTAMMAVSLFFASGSAVPAATDSKSSSSSTARSRSMHEARASSPFLNVADISLGDPSAIKMNESIAEEVAQPDYSEGNDLPEYCIGNATQDAFQSLLDTDLSQANLEDVITVMQSNPQNTYPDACNDVIVKCWANVRNKDCLLDWQTLVKGDDSVGNFASQIANQIFTGPSIRACGLPWVGNSADGWCGGFVCSIYGVQFFGDVDDQLNPSDWPSNAVMSKCGGEVQTSTYYTLGQTACKNCG